MKDETVEESVKETTQEQPNNDSNSELINAINKLGESLSAKIDSLIKSNKPVKTDKDVTVVETVDALNNDGKEGTLKQETKEVEENVDTEDREKIDKMLKLD